MSMTFLLYLSVFFVVLISPNAENVIIANAINIRTINNSLVRVKYLTNNTLVISHIDPNLM
jgi:hypothetical protein